MSAVPRLTSAMLVAILCRQVQAAGGFAAVLRHGDDRAGAVLIECVDRGERQMVLEYATGLDGHGLWRALPQPAGDADQGRIMLEKRVRTDPDLWILELDVANVERFIDAIII